MTMLFNTCDCIMSVHLFNILNDVIGVKWDFILTLWDKQGNEKVIEKSHFYMTKLYHGTTASANQMYSFEKALTAISSSYQNFDHFGYQDKTSVQIQTWWLTCLVVVYRLGRNSSPFLRAREETDTTWYQGWDTVRESDKKPKGQGKKPGIYF